MKNAAQIVLTLACVAFAALAAYNVLADNAEVTALARSAACEPESAAACKAQMTQNARSPFGQSFTFVAGPGKPPVTVACRRAAIVLGAYACARGS